MANVIGLYSGRIRAATMGGRQVETAIDKRAVTGPVRVGPLGLDGDQHGDSRHHGGADRALCVYAEERYPYWEKRLGRPLAAPAFGENARVAGRLEEDVALGEVWEVGEARLQVTESREPCVRPAAHNREPRLTAWMARSGYTGYLLRVLEPGHIEAGQAIEVVERPARALTVMELNRLAFRDRDDVAGLRAALSCEGLLQEWREALEQQLRRAGG